jgi:hypothetical protein
MRNKVFFGLIGVMLIMGFVFVGCDNGTTDADTGTAPTLTSVIVASSEANANAWTSASSFTLSTDTIYTGIECSDPDGDIAFYDFTLSIGGVEKGTLRLPLLGSISTTFKGYFCFSDMANDNNTYPNTWSVDTGYTIKITLIDSKGNKSATIASNTFDIN